MRAGVLTVKRGDAPMWGWGRSPTPMYVELHKKSSLLHLYIWKSSAERRGGKPALSSVAILPEFIFKMPDGFAIRGLGSEERHQTIFTTEAAGDAETWFAVLTAAMVMTRADATADAGTSPSADRFVKSIHHQPIQRFVYDAINAPMFLIRQTMRTVEQAVGAVPTTEFASLAAKEHERFLEGMARFDRAELEAIIMPNAEFHGMTGKRHAKAKTRCVRSAAARCCCACTEVANMACTLLLVLALPPSGLCSASCWGLTGLACAARAQVWSTAAASRS